LSIIDRSELFYKGKDIMTYHLQNDNEIDTGSTLVSRNITVSGRRTSVRLEPEMWRALKEISTRENCSIHELCSLISFRKNKRTSLTAAIRVFLMLYFRAATTEDGHGKAGHGSFDSMKRRAGWHERGLANKAQNQPQVQPLPSFLSDSVAA
jgi:predicted DNA-binding ribbon-helix-helix protein